MAPHAPVVLDVAGTTLTARERERLRHPLVGGVIHFARNWHSRAQLSALNAEIKAIRPDLLIAVDHEGGRVQRFRTDGFTHLPPMRALGQMWHQDGKGGPGSGALAAMRAATACGFVLAAELRACGVDLSFTPVLDLDWPDEDAPAPAEGQAPPSRSRVIGDRSFHADPRVVAALAKSLVLGLLQAGMGSCGKHFPGHGFVKADSHVDVPVDRRSLKAILAADATPFDWLSNSLGSVMPAHVIYPKVDERPAGFSRKWLQDILRGRLGFGGVIFSDDLSMAGARVLDGQALSYAQAALAALQAGCDLVLLCNQSVVDEGQALDRLLDELAEAQVRQTWVPEEASELRRRQLLPAAPARDWDTLMRTPAYLQALSLVP